MTQKKELSDITNTSDETGSSQDRSRGRRGGMIALTVLEILSLVGLFYLMSHGSPPGVNEPHYLCKAKNFWDNSFCAKDIFLDSADAHLLFYLTVGWLTKFFTLATTAWIGRILCWISIAIGWRMFSMALFPKRGYALLTAGLALTFIQHFHFAGEWLIGGVEAKGFAYAFLFAGMSFLVRGKWTPVWILFGIAASFHVLVGGWGVIAGLVACLLSFGERGRWKDHLIGLPVGFVCSLPGLLPALWLTVGHPEDVVNQANQIYTFERISHHLVFSHIQSTQPERYVFFLAALIFWFTASILYVGERGFRKFNAFVFGTVCIGVSAIVIEWWATRTDDLVLATKLLRYYWFRLSDLFVPIGAAFSLVIVLREIFNRCYDAGAIMLTILVAVVFGQVGWMQYQQAIDHRPHADRMTLISIPGQHEFNSKHFQDWIDVCVWIRTSTDPDSRFITPRSQSTFKWYAHRSEVASWKDVPQDAKGVVAWNQTFRDVYSTSTFAYGLASPSAERRLMQLAERYDAGYLVIERRHVRNRKRYLESAITFYLGNQIGTSLFKSPRDLKPLFLKQVYPNRNCSEEIIRESSFLVYQLVIPDVYTEKIEEIERILTEIQNWFDKKNAANQN